VHIQEHWGIANIRNYIVLKDAMECFLRLKQIFENAQTQFIPILDNYKYIHSMTK